MVSGHEKTPAKGLLSFDYVSESFAKKGGIPPMSFTVIFSSAFFFLSFFYQIQWVTPRSVGAGV